MDYNKIVQGILDIGEAMLICGAENFRLDDSLYRMCRSYGFKRYDVFAIPSNIQITVETPEGEIITQIRHIESTDIDFDRLDYLNNLSRYVCQHKPDGKQLREKYEEVMSRPPQKPYTKYFAAVMGGTGFAVFFGCDFADAIVAVLVSLMIVVVGGWLSKREENLLVYNLILSFLSEVIIIVAVRLGLGSHPERIMIGIVMLLISGLSTTNGIREVLQRDFISGFLNIMNSILGAAGIACGTALAMLLLKGVSAEGYILNHNIPIQLISCTIACIGFAFWFKIRGRQVVYSGVGAFFTWGIYVVVYHFWPSNFLATLVASVFVAFYAFIMSRINKAPSTIFLTASVFPLIPGPNLYYMMYGCVSRDNAMAFNETIILLVTCLAIAFGFNIVDILSRSVMKMLKREYHIGKNS
ncbi:threonine/serine exporter family protein [Bariatricus massiliensis]|uniref:Threonine/serine exporter family protein n=1 Tax=Bariatricus massiliensis TaxID=1745713 RepID=A0ABS8DL75_9FIRM|nr:threonine/serine exporter family protein [Bariatricus massiliensis]MCB7306068.1 threonine/serine exporter family protein [Bariatricus massiliensis]MCB7376563.1 threonine/serine exporter family protein [Bariatricus massiliensis]MCB7389211.1 threonine/serine exporter family protein [Bariatricus massiliensis]MCB7413384.1 threonine/serine exporter family protein [Bariatricus massiliensis]MCQ5255288.1 threonine/serine exporter family protein [Bariatricus massiliensis]